MGGECTMTDAGKVSFRDRGDYNAATQYERLDYVKYQDTIFIARKSTVGNTPNPSADTEFWMVAVKGLASIQLYDNAGDPVTKRGGIQFSNAQLTDDATNGKTIVLVGIPQTEWNSIKNILGTT